jgi:multidrug resistance efflux pump
MMKGTGRIPIPWQHRWRRFRYGVLPVLGLAAFAAATFWLWSRQGAQPLTLGEVEAVRVDVTTGAAGILAPLPRDPWTLFDVVDANQIVARLDERPIRAQLATLTEELSRWRKELDAAASKLALSEADRAQTYLTETTRLRVDFERICLAVLDHRLAVETDRLELQRRDMRLECLKPLHVKKMISDLEMKNEQMLRDEVAKRLAEDSKDLAEAQTQQRNAETRLKQFPGLRAADVAKLLAPIAAAAEVQMARIRELQIEITRLAIRAPTRGIICAVHRRPGDTVRPGDPIVTVAAEQGRYIVSYVRQEQRLEPKVGMPVEVRVRAPVSRPLVTKVERVGPQVEPIPLHQCRDPRVPEWGLPVRIALPDGFSVRPGELLEVTFKHQAKDEG